MFERLFRKLTKKFDPEGRIQLLRSSEDPELGEYLESVQAQASTDMDIDGFIYVKIHDRINPSKGVWLEELAHALQFIKEGNVPLSHDDHQRRARELEVAYCLYERADRQKLPQEDIAHFAQAIEYYRG